MGKNDPWEKLGVLDALRVDSVGRYDFFWVVIESGMPGLMLRLPALPEPAPRLPKLKNLVAYFRKMPTGAAFVLALKENAQRDIFTTLCRDVVEAGEAGETLDDALSRALQRTRRWHYLMRGGSPGGLTIEEQRGLVAELAFLRRLATAFGPETAIEAWTGPQGAAKDFELIRTCVEVKAHRSAAKPFVAIASEDQLADVDGCRLCLHVVNVASAVLPEGQSLHDHVRLTAVMFEDGGGVLDAWEEALHATGYDPANSYDDRRWLLGSSADYEVVEGFPRISAPLMPGVSGVRYSIALDACDPFRLQDELVNVIRDGLRHDRS